MIEGQAGELIRQGRAGRTICPECGGGSHREASLSVRPVDDLHGVWKVSCWRATCGYWEVVGGPVAAKLDQFKPRVFDFDTEALWGSRMGAYLEDTYDLSVGMLDDRGWRATGERGPLVMPVFDRYGRKLGTMTRTFESPKEVRQYREHDYPEFMDWWATDAISPDVFIVEDQLSAACLHQDTDISVVALLGTNLTPSGIQEIAKYANGGRIYVALDNDVFLKTLDYAQKYAHFGRVVPVYLERDIKDMNGPDVVRLVEGLTGG